MTTTSPLASTRGRWIVLATVLGSSLAMLDGFVVNIALPKIGTDLDTDVAGLQWTVTGYTLTLAAFILLGGSLSDRLGRRKVFVWGTTGFAIASLMCAVSPTVQLLIAARVVQGVAGAMVTPGSLALISASIDAEDRGAAVGLWSGLGGVASAAGPLLGGWLVEIAGWRSVFLINLPLAAAVVAVSMLHVPESHDPNAPAKLDVLGALIAAVGLGALTYGLIAATWPISVVGVALMVAFVVVERRSAHPLVPPSLFASRLFDATNLVTFAVYAALGGGFFLVILQLQIVSGYSPLTAGIATVPVTILMLVLSPSAGRWAQRHGPRIPMTVGPGLVALGMLAMVRIGTEASYLVDVLPGLLIFGLGLSALVAPLTTAVLSSVSPEEAGVASGVNNAVARTSQLLAVAALPGLAGISTFTDPHAFGQGFRIAMYISAGLLVAGGAIAYAMVSDQRSQEPV
ncbi:MFS transporter [Antrihabitans cavernicola]|uniref:MFS transporter n=1 Tax=Antrihabitans cavernicola TaxID=2495913 RepID=A0A5A7SA03_9NOCA|nr:MFS transporter [Spelaeibacter cavernicola]KAA0021403.1 MFS transporter [Spelaeibacter cavernicola]